MKRAFFAAALLGALGLAVVAPVSAHHSFAATYFEDQTTKIEGDLVQFQFRNPHSYVHLEAKDDKGVIQRWTIEWGSGMQLSTQGLTATTLKVGAIEENRLDEALSQLTRLLTKAIKDAKAKHGPGKRVRVFLRADDVSTGPAGRAEGAS